MTKFGKCWIFKVNKSEEKKSRKKNKTGEVEESHSLKMDFVFGK